MPLAFTSLRSMIQIRQPIAWVDLRQLILVHSCFAVKLAEALLYETLVYLMREPARICMRVCRLLHFLYMVVNKDRCQNNCRLISQRLENGHPICQFVFHWLSV